MFVSEGPLDKKWALVRVMARCRIGGKPLPEPILTRVTDAFMRHQGGGGGGGGGGDEFN